MKKILISFFALFVLAVAAVLGVPGLIDWNNYRGDIVAQVKNAIGRDIVINGDLNIRLLPSPAVLAGDVRVANLDGASSDTMAHLRVLEVRVALAPLLSGNIQVEKIQLVDPLVVLEVLPDGRRNWDLGRANGAPASPSSETGTPAAPGDGGAVQLDAFAIQNGTFIYRDARTGAAYEVGGVNADISARSLSGPFESRGDFIFKGLPFSYTAFAGRIDGEEIPFSFDVQVPPANIKATFSGQARGLAAAPALDGNFRLEGPGTGFAALGGTLKTLPGFLKERLVLEGSLQADAKGVASKDVTVRIAGMDAIGAASFDFEGASGVPALALDLRAARINLDDWLGRKPVPVLTLPVAESVRVSVSSEGRALVAIPAPGTANKGTASQGAASKGNAGLFPDSFSAAVSVGIDTITYRGDVVSQAQAALELAGGEVTVSQLSAILPGVTTVAAFGYVAGDADGSPVFEGELEAGSSDVRGLAGWFGVKDLGVPSDRLRSMAFASKVRATQAEIQLPGLRLNVDQSKVTGGVTLALRKRLAFGADLAIDQVNLDRYLQGAGAPAPATGTGASPAPASASTGGAGALAAISALDAFDTNLKVAIKALTHQGRVYRTVVLDGTLYNGELNLRNVSVGDIAGARLQFAGGLAGLGGLPEMKQATFDLTAPDPGRLAQAFGVAVPDVVSRIGAIRFSGAAEGSFLKPQVDASLKAAGGEVLVKGALSTIPLTSLFNGRLAVRHENFDQALRTLGAGYHPSGTLGGIDVAATVKVDMDAVSMSAIHGQVGPVPVEGAIDASLVGARPKIKVDLRTGIVPVRDFLPAGDPLKKPAPGAAGATGTTAKASSSSAATPAQPGRARPVSDRWSTDPIDFSALTDFDGEVALTAKGVTFDSYSLENATMKGTLNKGVLTISEIVGTFFGGAVTGSARVDAARGPQFQGALRLADMDVAQATLAVSGKSLAAGRMKMNLDVNTTGRSVAGMVAGLGGAGDFAVTNLDVRGSGAGSVLSGLIGVFAGINDVISGILPLGKNEKGLADVTSRFTMQDGVAQLADFSFVSREGKGRAAGVVDVAGWWLDVSGEVALPDTLLANILARNSKTRSLPFTARGALDAPKVVVKADVLGGGIGTLLDKTGIGKVLGTGTPSPAPTPAPSSPGGTAPPPQVPPEQRSPDATNETPKTIKPEDVLNSILRGVIQGQ